VTTKLITELTPPTEGKITWEPSAPAWRLEGSGYRTIPSAHRMMGDVPVYRYDLGRGSGTRLPAIRSSPDTEFYAVALVLEGEADCSSPSLHFRLQAGDIATWNSQEITHFNVGHFIRKVTWFFPLSRINATLPSSLTRVGKHFGKDSALTSILSAHFTNIVSNGDRIHAHQLQYLSRMSLDIVSNILLAAEENLTPSPTEQLYLDVLAYIERNLKDCDLSPEKIANAFSISRRYLDMLFIRNASSVSGWVRSQRLDRCRAELELPSFHRTVSEIAMKWGFKDSSHFSRIFRQKFGHPPSEHRVILQK
jgi:AraC-like DNA-binding protein